MSFQEFEHFAVGVNQDAIYHKDDKMYRVLAVDKQEQLIELGNMLGLRVITRFWVRCENVTILPF